MTRHRGEGHAAPVEVKAISRPSRWGVVRSITAADDYRVRSVRDRVAKRTAWIANHRDVGCSGSEWTLPLQPW